mgnify:CR=1 FL=1
MNLTMEYKIVLNVDKELDFIVDNSLPNRHKNGLKIKGKIYVLLS